MAIIQMANDETIDVKESEVDVLGLIQTASHPIIGLTAKDSNGERPIFINTNQIISFM